MTEQRLPLPSYVERTDARPMPASAPGEGAQIREQLIDFATWISQREELDVATPDEAVDKYLGLS
jgi:hypothetical protein